MGDIEDMMDKKNLIINAAMSSMISMKANKFLEVYKPVLDITCKYDQEKWNKWVEQSMKTFLKDPTDNNAAQMIALRVMTYESSLRKGDTNPFVEELYDISKNGRKR
jgi:response regulator RpfG family c-di-GMP phosphodiesterase